MIRERCSCGAEFETDEDHAVKLMREWRTSHRHEHTPTPHDSDLTASTDIANDPRVPELHIGFRSDPFDDE